jgi:hypothetical protein
MMAKSSRMKFKISAVVRSVFVTLILVALSQPAHAFYSWKNDDQTIEMRGLLLGSGLALRNPDNQIYYHKGSVSDFAASGRLMLDASCSERFSFELHAVQNYIPMELQTGGSNLTVLRDIERSDLLDWGFDGKSAHLLIDRVNFQYASDKLNLKIGRQPLNLAATFYFTPNDFFAPFAAQIFYRDYKPGVDAVRADVQMAELSQLTLISVLGYRVDAVSDNGWSNRMDTARNSYLARASSVWGDFELAFLVGSVRKDRIVGVDFQGEMFDWLGVRGEGHINFPDQAGQGKQMELAVGVEHRWENSFTLRIEQFYHGSGASDSGSYNLFGTMQGFYLARHYTAGGVSYEFTPLLNGDATAIYNWVDNSALIALYLLYSLSDESELAMGSTVTAGRRPFGATLRSEFGLYPASASIEFRAYF